MPCGAHARGLVSSFAGLYQKRTYVFYVRQTLFPGHPQRREQRVGQQGGRLPEYRRERVCTVNG